MLEDALKTDGILGIDALWASVVVFPNTEITAVAVSTYDDVAKAIVRVAISGDRDAKAENAIYTRSFRAGLEELVGVVEEEIDKMLDRYEGDLDGAKKEASERFKRGFFDGGVALMGRVATWDREANAWSGWENGNKNGEGWEEEVKKVARLVRTGKIGGDGCGC
jgi:soluble cytochrome b562